MNILPTKAAFRQYELTASYIVLMLQYLYILVFAKNVDTEIATQYVELFFYDMMLFFPIIILIYFPLKFRLIIFASLVAGGIIYFLIDFGLNTIVVNTFISILIANRFLLLKISKDEKDEIFKARLLKVFVLFPVIVVTVLSENALELLGITHPKILADGKMMTDYGKFIFFGGFYGALAYFSYRTEKNKADHKIVN